MSIPLRRTIAWEFHERLILLVVGDEDPSNHEWDRFVEGCRERAALNLSPGVLVHSSRGAATSRQRRQIAELSVERKTPQAVIVTSAIGRGVVAAMAWLGISNKAFSPDELDQAYAFIGGESLGVSLSEVRARLDVLRSRLHERAA